MLQEATPVADLRLYSDNPATGVASYRETPMGPAADRAGQRRQCALELPTTNAPHAQVGGNSKDLADDPLQTAELLARITFGA
jgi:hypothetical protein